MTVAALFFVGCGGDDSTSAEDPAGASLTRDLACSLLEENEVEEVLDVVIERAEVTGNSGFSLCIFVTSESERAAVLSVSPAQFHNLPPATAQVAGLYAMVLPDGDGLALDVGSFRVSVAVSPADDPQASAAELAELVIPRLLGDG